MNEPKEKIERDLGPQPLITILQELNLKAHDLVETNPVSLNHKMVARACKGRKLTTHSQYKILAALNKAANRTFNLEDIFNYRA